ncbi:MAG: hypothetical protein RL559_287 [Pseudomonadota bacterium]|jgi:tripartite-type tricarboxylate transporter receptor subunit TctC
MKLTRKLFCSVVALALAAPMVQAQSDYPNKPIRIVVPYAAGGGTDALARIVAKSMTTHLGQTVLVDNKPGGGTAIGASEIARAAPDGYNLLWGDNTTFSLNPFLYKKLSYSPMDDFAPISLTLKGALTLVAAPNTGFKSVADVLAYAKANPAKLQYGSAGNGTPHHLAMEALKLRAGVQMLHVPYKGEGPGLNDLLGGVTQLMFVGNTIAKQHVEGGRLKALATADGARNASMPDLPTVGETLPGFSSNYWHALVAPAKTPAAIIQKINEAYGKAIREPEVVAFMTKSAAGNTLNLTTPAELRKHMEEQLKVSAELVKAIDLKMD